jgi:hypothetical protein
MTVPQAPTGIVLLKFTARGASLNARVRNVGLLEFHEKGARFPEQIPELTPVGKRQIIR